MLRLITAKFRVLSLASKNDLQIYYHVQCYTMDDKCNFNAKFFICRNVKIIFCPIILTSLQTPVSGRGMGEQSLQSFIFVKI